MEKCISRDLVKQNLYSDNNYSSFTCYLIASSMILLKHDFILQVVNPNYGSIWKSTQILQEIKKTLTNINSQNGYFCNGYSVVVAKK
jgi:hypothetical protein